MSVEDDIPFADYVLDDYEIPNSYPKKQRPIKPIKKILISLALLLVIGYAVTVSLSFILVDVKKSEENDKKDLPNNKTNHDNRTYYYHNITAVYSCPGDYKNCSFYSPFLYNFTSSISSISVNGTNVSVTNYHQFEESDIKIVTIVFNEKIKNMTGFFYLSYNLLSVDFSNFDSSEMIDMRLMFFNCRSLKSITWGPHFSTSKVVSMYRLFRYCDSLTSIDLSIFDTSNVISFEAMFAKTKKIQKLDLGNFKTSSAVNFDGMFFECNSLTSLDLSKFDTSKAKSMNYMFANCISLKSINLNNFDTRNVISMKNMFQYCSSLESLDLSNFNTSSLEDANNIFYRCSNLVSIKQNFTSTKLRNAYGMFCGCYALEKNDLRGFVGEALTNMKAMFANCRSLTSIDLRNFAGREVRNYDYTFSSIGDRGYLVYNSSKIKSTILKTLPTEWEKIDVKT